MSRYSEKEEIEGAVLEALGQLGWELTTGAALGGERKTLREVLLHGRLEAALRRLNPDVPAEAIQGAMALLAEDRMGMGLVAANREVHQLLTGGVKIAVRNPETGKQEDRIVRVIDWERPENNDYLAVSQLRVQGPVYLSIPDVVLFVNGLPLVVIEVKRRRVPVRQAYDENFTQYKDPQAGIPRLFAYNAFLIASNGTETKVGSLTADWERFFDWKRVEREDEARDIPLRAALRGTCDKARLLDIVRNFTVFATTSKGLVKIIAQNHQFLGVNQAIEAMLAARAKKSCQGGVFWHTQGSGKSFSMVFYAQKILRTVPGDWTFVIVTDRVELDEQIAGTFASVGAVKDAKVGHATSGEHLRQLLSKENHRYVFTLIHKFQSPEVLCDRHDVIVIADEAHRSQYDTLALNMRCALPNAIFVAFTGTPLMVGEEKTKEVFGEYVSIYDFEQSIQDGATVPLYYENRTPELELANPEGLNDEIYAIIDEAGLDEASEARLQKALGQRYQLITRDDRLDKVAADIVQHFLNRGFQGKAMVVSIDKKTAKRTYGKVQNAWAAEKKRVEEKLKAYALEANERERLRKRLEILNRVEMALVVSPSQGDDADIKEELARIAKWPTPVDKRFKDPKDPLSIVFVCAMWLTGFDAPSVSTVYLDKPMRDHTLMQTIARANRVFPGKQSGTIVDYVNVFASLEEAFAYYARGEAGRTPVREKGHLVEELRKVLAGIDELCAGAGVSLEAIEKEPSALEREKLIQAAADALSAPPDRKKTFRVQARLADHVYAALLPHKDAGEFQLRLETLAEIRAIVEKTESEKDISAALDAIGKVLDKSIKGVLDVKEGPGPIDLSRLDFEALAKRFATSKTKNLDIERLKAAILARLERMIAKNETRVDFREKFEELIEAHNKGAMSIEKLFEELLKLSRELDEEETRHVRESLTEEELVVFDLLTRPAPPLSAKERDEVKAMARELLTKVRAVLKPDWKKTEQAKARVKRVIKDALDELPEAYSDEEYEAKIEAIFQHVYERYGEAA